MAILSIQSHVVYGYVGNKAAVYPLQSMGYDVWPVNTVQFSSHTGYKNWQGDVFSREHIKKVINALEGMESIGQCRAILSGYMGSQDICFEVKETVERFKARNDKLLYLCDPVMGNVNCFVKPEVVDFFKNNLIADIITPNQFEAEMLSGVKINNVQDLKETANDFHNLGIKVVVITGVKCPSLEDLCVFVSDGAGQYVIPVREYDFEVSPNGTGDLFSAVFLGSYLSHHNALEAVKSAVYFMDLVLRNTFEAKIRELQVISARYDNKIKSEILAISL
jgi:pyridoxine kinase